MDGHNHLGHFHQVRLERDYLELRVQKDCKTCFQALAYTFAELAMHRDVMVGYNESMADGLVLDTFEDVAMCLDEGD